MIKFPSPRGSAKCTGTSFPAAPGEQRARLEEVAGALCALVWLVAFHARHAGEANKSLGLRQDLEVDTEQGLGVSVPVGVTRHRATLTTSLVNMALCLEPWGLWGPCCSQAGTLPALLWLPSPPEKKIFFDMQISERGVRQGPCSPMGLQSHCCCLTPSHLSQGSCTRCGAAWWVSSMAMSSVSLPLMPACWGTLSPAPPPSGAVLGAFHLP